VQPDADVILAADLGQHTIVLDAFTVLVIKASTRSLCLDQQIAVIHGILIEVLDIGTAIKFDLEYHAFKFVRMRISTAIIKRVLEQIISILRLER
jgi:hypothetical protein